MTIISLRCQCGTVKGHIDNATPSSGNHVVCCCSDCQAFAHSLDTSTEILDAFGGTRIYQTSQSQLTISEGAEQLRCLRLTPKGLPRWHTGCCNPPVGNTVSASMPFVGVIHSFIDDANQSASLGLVRAWVQTQHATSAPDYPRSAKGFPVGITIRLIFKMLGWKLRGMHKPSAFFDANGQPVSKPVVAQPAEPTA